MFFSTTQEVWYSVASICLTAITIFLCLALYRLMHVLGQVDSLLTMMREKATSLEETVELLAERFTSISGYASLVTEGGKKLFSLLKGGSKNPRRKKGTRLLSDEE